MHGAQVWSVKELTAPEKIVRDADSFPGPASSAPASKLKAYVEGRAACASSAGNGEQEENGEWLLWSVTALSMQFKVGIAWRGLSFSTVDVQYTKYFASPIDWYTYSFMR